MTNEANIAIHFAGNWEWGTSIIVSITGVYLIYKVYKYAKKYFKI